MVVREQPLAALSSFRAGASAADRLERQISHRDVCISAGPGTAHAQPGRSDIFHAHRAGKGLRVGCLVGGCAA